MQGRDTGTGMGTELRRAVSRYKAWGSKPPDPNALTRTAQNILHEPDQHSRASKEKSRDCEAESLHTQTLLASHKPPCKRLPLFFIFRTPEPGREAKPRQLHQRFFVRTAFQTEKSFHAADWWGCLVYWECGLQGCVGWNLKGSSKFSSSQSSTCSLTLPVLSICGKKIKPLSLWMLPKVTWASKAKEILLQRIGITL